MDKHKDLVPLPAVKIGRLAGRRLSCAKILNVYFTFQQTLIAETTSPRQTGPTFGYSRLKDSLVHLWVHKFSRNHAIIRYCHHFHLLGLVSLFADSFGRRYNS